MKESTVKQMWGYVGWLFVISIPFYIAGGMSTAQILPGLPISALGFITPTLAAMAVLAGSEGRDGVTRLLRRAIAPGPFRSMAGWALALGLQPVVMALAFAVQRCLGVPIPAPAFSPWSAGLLFIMFLISGLFEELGWSGFATDRLQKRYGILKTGLLLGGIWAVWHFIPLLQAQRSWTFIAGWTVGTLANRVILVWIYTRTGRSVLAAVVYHAMINLVWQLYPVNGSFYDAWLTGGVTALAAAVLLFSRRSGKAMALENQVD